MRKNAGSGGGAAAFGTLKDLESKYKSNTLKDLEALKSKYKNKSQTSLTGNDDVNPSLLGGMKVKPASFSRPVSRSTAQIRPEIVSNAQPGKNIVSPYIFTVQFYFITLVSYQGTARIDC